MNVLQTLLPLKLGFTDAFKHKLAFTDVDPVAEGCTDTYANHKNF